MLKYFNKIKNKINKFDKLAKNPFLQTEHSYNPCVNCVAQTYVWIEEDNKNNFLKKTTATNPNQKK